MALSARIEEAPGSLGRSREPRRKITLEASGALESGAAAEVTVHNISATGMLIECREPMKVGETLVIDLPESDATPAQVIWSSGPLHGCQFAEPVSNAILSAAQLRAAVGQQVEVSGPVPSAASEPFGLRLQRLRKQRGLSLAQVAAELEVSKPTVWAWEQGRARPLPDRIDLLAHVLGTSSESLQTGRDDRALAEVLERSRRRIAEACGARPENIRIMIEL